MSLLHIHFPKLLASKYMETKKYHTLSITSLHCTWQRDLLWASREWRWPDITYVYCSLSPHLLSKSLGDLELTIPKCQYCPSVCKPTVPKLCSLVAWLGGGERGTGPRKQKPRVHAHSSTCISDGLAHTCMQLQLNCKSSFMCVHASPPLVRVELCAHMCAEPPHKAQFWIDHSVVVEHSPGVGDPCSKPFSQCYSRRILSASPDSTNSEGETEEISKQIAVKQLNCFTSNYFRS